MAMTGNLPRRARTRLTLIKKQGQTIKSEGGAHS